MNVPPTRPPVSRRKLGFRRNFQKKLGFSGARMLVPLFRIIHVLDPQENHPKLPQDSSGLSEYIFSTQSLLRLCFPLENPNASLHQENNYE